MADDRLPLYQRLRDDMLVRISSGQWALDQAIPPEHELAAMHQVSVGTVRRAIDTLIEDRLLERKQGRGTYVRRPDFNASLFRFFRQLDSQGKRVVPTAQVLVCEKREAELTAAEALGVEQGAKLIYLERVRYVDEEPLLFEEIWLVSPAFDALLEVSLNDFGNLLYPFYESCCQQHVARANETLSIATANETLANTLQMVADQPVVTIERVALGFAGEALEYRRSRGDASSFRYQASIS